MAAALAASTVYAGGESHRLDDVVVTGTRTEHALKDVPVETMVISREDIENSHGHTIMELLSSVPGVNTSISTDLFGGNTWRSSMRGLPFYTGYGLILVDGERVHGAGQSGGHGEFGPGLNQIPLSMIERIEVVKGAGAALYGSDAVAGVINIITRRTPDEPSISTEVTYGSYTVVRDTTGDGDLEEADGDRTFRKASVSYGDALNDRFGYFLNYTYEESDDVGADPLRSHRHSLMKKWDWDMNDVLDVDGKLEYSDYAGRGGDRTEDSKRFSLGATYTPQEGHRFRAGGYTYLWDFEQGPPGNPHGYRYGDISYNQLALTYTGYLGDMHTLSVGVEGNQQILDYKTENTHTDDDGNDVITVVTSDEDIRTASIFVQDEFQVVENLTLVGALRYDDHSTFGGELSPKFNLMARLTDHTTLRGSVGKSYKSPTIRQLYYDIPYRHGDSYRESNRDLNPEIGLSISSSVEQWLLDDMITLTAGYFYNSLEDMVVRQEIGTYEGLPLLSYRNIEEAVTQGVEVMSQFDLPGGMGLDLSYTATFTENKETGNELTYVPRHDASGTVRYFIAHHGIGLSFGINGMSSQYTDAANTNYLEPSVVANARVMKEISDNARISFAMDDIFESRVGERTGSWFRGRSLSGTFTTNF
ncbi:TonB-dependent receptor plug domain-containing protein [Chitinivibrio alkaliphilus]|uniref:TonB-dependent receptor plug domain-containing protein n=1 Tax=Chitinivibrio alkaliphilus TaxID=1505232 RepID=UPI0012DBD3F0|nr:TonB-dependent receptor [Chitinivibrio alkaliphilus]